MQDSISVKFFCALCERAFTGWGLGSRLLGLGFRFQGSGCKVWGMVHELISVLFFCAVREREDFSGCGFGLRVYGATVWGGQCEGRF